ncbi:MAG: peptidoglycan DD-metalloendopeptidase family protein [Thauera sp.]|nr:peptidoglycan DD-metalloendopeptidase family protein [Thauera sp.]
MQARKTRILAELPQQLLTRPRPWLLAGVTGLSLLGVVAATAVAPGSDTAGIPTATLLETLPSPKLNIEAPEADLPFVHSERVRSGDTLQSLFQRLGIDDDEALSFFSNADEGKRALRQLRAGRNVTALISANGRLHSFSLPIGGGEQQLVLERDARQALQLSTVDLDNDSVELEMRAGSIRSSLYGATDAAGIPDHVATQMAQIFGTEIDFRTDLRKDDRFSVIYEMHYRDGAPVRPGRIVAAEFINRGKRHAVVLHRGPSGKEQYYSEEGRSLRQGFLRSPLAFTRISSSFGGRTHPISKKWRAHKGTDFAAPTGTPVKASSDGVVDLAGVQNGYGKIVILKHRGNISTAYAHLNGFAKGLKKGQQVSQGDVIGYVGSTGWATGPHLHYEVRINNVAHDPMKVALPMADSLNARELAAFRKESEQLRKRFALLNYEVASTEGAR